MSTPISSPAQNGSRFGIPITAEVRKIIERLPVGTETDSRRVRGQLLAAYPELKGHPDEGMLTTYISQSITLLLDKSVVLSAKGSGGQPNIYRRITANGAATPPPKPKQDPDKKQSVKRQEIAKAEKPEQAAAGGGLAGHCANCCLI